MKPLITRPSFQTWLENTQLIAKEDSKLFVAVPNAFVAEHIKDRLYSLVVHAAEQIIEGDDIEIEFVVIIPEESRNGVDIHPK